MQFRAKSDLSVQIGLLEIAERHANGLQIPAHLDAEGAASFATDHFRRQIIAELEMIELVALEDSPSCTSDPHKDRM